MTDDTPRIVLGLGDDGAPVAIVGPDETQVTDMVALLAAAPGLAADPAQAARAMNHLAQGAAFAVIDDPAGYRADYLRKLAAEDPSQPWAEGVMRLGDHGVPDFAQIAPPRIAGTVLDFCAFDTFLGLPYRVTIDLAAGTGPGDDAYRPLELVPVDTAAPEDDRSDAAVDALQAMMEGRAGG